MEECWQLPSIDQMKYFEGGYNLNSGQSEGRLQSSSRQQRFLINCSSGQGLFFCVSSLSFFLMASGNSRLLGSGQHHQGADWCLNLIQYLGGQVNILPWDVTKTDEWHLELDASKESIFSGSTSVGCCSLRSFTGTRRWIQLHTHARERLFILVTSNTDPWQFYFGPAAELIRPRGQEALENNWCWCM